MIHQTKAHVNDDYELNIVVPKIKEGEESYQEDVVIHVIGE
jgi:hypothetical protein